MSEGALKLVQGEKPEQSLVDEALWKPKRTAEFLGMSVHWVYRSAERGELPYRKIGASLRFIPAEIRAWVDQSRMG